MVSANFRPKTLRDQQLMFLQIYGEHNHKLYGNGDDTNEIRHQIWEKLSEISECIEKERVEESLQHLPVLYGWLMALWNRLGLDISEVVWNKYPGICPYCFREDRCLCITEDLKYDPAKTSLNVFRRDVQKKPKSVQEWQAHFKRIYGNINKIKALIAVWLHFTREVGEVSREIRHKNRRNIEDESADVFAWLLTFCTKINVDIDELVWQTYPGECNVCHLEKCDCPYD